MGWMDLWSSIQEPQLALAMYWYALILLSSMVFSDVQEIKL